MLSGLICIILSACEKEDIFTEPIVEFDIVWADSTFPAYVTFINKSTNVNEYYWDFGDGYTSNEESPVHMYESDGEYKIVLKGRNSDKEASFTKTLIIPEVFLFSITNHSDFVLYNLESFSTDKHRIENNISFGRLESMQSTDVMHAQGDKIYLSFTNDNGVKFESAFPFILSSDNLNDLVIDRYTLVIIDESSK